MNSNRDDLAINGGPPAVTCGPFPWPPQDEAIRVALEQAWRDGDWGRYHGRRCERLRAAIGEMHGVEHTHLCSSGTAAVELALRAVGVAAGDGVLLAGYDFPGNFRAVEAVGALPVLVDIGATTWSLDAEAVAEHADEAESLGVKAVVVSHLHGGLADMPRLRRLADQRGWKLVEDACQAIGASLAGRPVGAWGDVGVFSFGGSKLLTAGRGGAVITNDAACRQRMRVFTGRGNDLLPLSELQAAVLLPQFEKLADRHEMRLHAVRRLVAATSRHHAWVDPVATRDDSSHAYYKFAWRLREPDLAGPNLAGPKLADTVAAWLQAEGAPIDRGFRGFVGRGTRRCRRLGVLSESRRSADGALLLHHPVLQGLAEAIPQIAVAFDKIAAAAADLDLPKPGL